MAFAKGLAEKRGGHLRFKYEHTAGGKAVKHAFEQALDAVIAPVEVNPLRGAEAHDDRVGGVGFGRLNEVFPPKTTIVRKDKRVN